MKGIYFTMNEIKRLTIIQSVIDKKRTAKEASILLNISERQIWRLVSKIKNEGHMGIKHKNKFNKPKHSFDPDFKKRVYDLKISDDYCDTNFLHIQQS